ncbi:MAG: DNA-3-methyladenine glycosylase I [Elusimicrobia bacterium]|nr:DNA-3-methyladenine glycosylase I [Elusimicrobiota bacterium]
MSRGRLVPPLIRCPWPVADDPLYLAYHDEEWGVPAHDDRRLYEFLVLETFQAVDWAKDLKRRGFSFLGPTVVYAHMQAVGMVNDHVVTCFRYRQLA